MAKVNLLLLAILFFPLINETGYNRLDNLTQHTPWTEPYRLSTGNGRVGESRILADHYGNIHAFWIETGMDGGRSSIFYAVSNGKFWTVPVDILSSADVTQISHLAAGIDSEGNLQLVWTSGGTFRDQRVYYSNAPVADAGSARSWRRPYQIASDAHLLDMLVDSKGGLHLFFTKFYSPDRGLYYSRSTDHGNNWTEPHQLDIDIPLDYAIGSFDTALDNKDGLHVTWMYNNANDATIVYWIRYSHSLDGGISWSVPFTVDKDEQETGYLRAAYPIIAAQGQNILILWAGGDYNYRNQRYSANAGLNWSEKARIQSFGDLNGQAFDDMVIDGDGRIHYLGQIRYPQGIYHAVWENGKWSKPELIYLITPNPTTPIINRIHAHQIEAAVLNGDHIIALFSDPPSDIVRHLYVIESILSDVVDVATPQPEPTFSVTPTPTQEVRSPNPTAVLTTVLPTDLSSGTAENTSSVSYAMVFATLPVIFFIVIIVVKKIVRG